MRRGYWKTLLRQLRGRVASGADTFLFHETRYTIAGVLASDDDALEPPALLPLAATAEGPTLFIDTEKSLVALDGEQATGLDLPRFIDALTDRAEASLRLGMPVDDADFPQLRPRRKSLLDD